MLIAIFSDIHGNREAFDACLADAEAEGAETFAFLGDLVGYGADPAYVVTRVAQLHAEGAPVVKGNHDTAIGDLSISMNHYARAAIEWTRERLSAAQKAFLADLPLTARQKDMLLVHAEASHPDKWLYISTGFDAARSMMAAEACVTFSGHTHRPCLFRANSSGPASEAFPVEGEPIFLDPTARWQVVIGSVGQPRDGNPAAAYALYDDENHIFRFTRVPYDTERAAEKIMAAGLPEPLAARLFWGE